MKKIDQLHTFFLNNPNKWIPRSEVAKHIGVSDIAILRYIHTLRKRGEKIKSKRGAGYFFEVKNDDLHNKLERIAVGTATSIQWIIKEIIGAESEEEIQNDPEKIAKVDQCLHDIENL